MSGNSSKNNVFRLKGSLQTYDWGKSGSDSLVAKFLKNAIGEDDSLGIEENKHYAEVC